MGKNSSNKLKFRPDMYFYGFYQIPEAFRKIFKFGQFSPYGIVYGCDRFPIKVFPGHKMAKNASNEMKYGPGMYFYVFYQTGMALRKLCVRDLGELVVRRFAYAKSFAYAIRVALKNRVAYAKSRTQNRVAYANRVRKSRT